MFEPGALPLTPASREASQIVSPDRTQRITLLTSGLIRFETTSEPGKFEDRASTFAINRHVDLPTPEIEVVSKPDGSGAMEIVTDRVYIQWTGAKFGPDSVLVTLRDKGEHPLPCFGVVSLPLAQAWSAVEVRDTLTWIRRR